MLVLPQHLRMPLDRPSSTTMTDRRGLLPPNGQFALLIYTCSLSLQMALFPSSDQASPKPHPRFNALLKLRYQFIDTPPPPFHRKAIYLSLFLSFLLPIHWTYSPRHWRVCICGVIKTYVGHHDIKGSHNTRVGSLGWIETALLAHCIGTWSPGACHCVEFDMGWLQIAFV
jgi:hypothetical protein